ncbi:MAG: kinase [Candidatus Omnitrophica bacterium]|nr:kinase [Candidatus Omnitrophota bacterium]
MLKSSTNWIISRTPYRISFFGGGTDYPEWYLKEGGAVLSTTIDKYCYLSCRFLPRFYNIKHRIVWSHIETVSSTHEILHPVVREAIRFLELDEDAGFEIHHQGDLPARSGIGSSSSFTVGLLNALVQLNKGISWGKQELALKAIELEQQVLREKVGSQDQMAASHGGLNLIRFSENGSIKVQSADIGEARVRELESNLCLLYLGTNRLGSEIASSITSNIDQKASALRHMHSMVDEAVSILKGDGDLSNWGRLLHESWLLKKSLSRKVTNTLIDHVYETARTHGALGGKLLGAGGTGFMIFYVPMENQPAVINALSHYFWVPFNFEFEGSSIIYDASNQQKLVSQKTGSYIPL